MRFISKTPQYRITAIKPKQRVAVLAGGLADTITEDPGFICEFRPHGLTAWEMDKAREMWAKDYANKIPRGGRLENKFGVWDSRYTQDSFIDRDGNRMSDDRRVEIESALKTKPNYGLRFIQVEKPRIVAPWPTYDEIATAQGVTLGKVSDQILSIMSSTGMDPDLVVAYERENLNRQAVIDAVVAKYSSDPAVTESTVKVPA